MKERLKKLIEKPVWLCIALSLIVNLLIEILSRHSLFETIKHMFTSPIIFVFNTLIIMSTMLIGLLFKRRFFAYGLVSILWLALGIANGIVLTYRTFPLVGDDFKKIFSVITITRVYYTTFQLILIGLAIAAVIVGLVFFFLKAPKRETNFKKFIVIIVVVWAITSALNIGLPYLGLIPKKFTDLPHDFDNYGFVYCFSSSVLDTGIDEPEDYSKESVNYIMSVIGKNTTKTVNKKPNIIYLQLESFYDAKYFNKFAFSKDPVPNFTALKEKYSSGFLTVPVIGAGTANVEFEIITGMSLEYFGPGEYPYKSVLRETTCETMAYNLKELGYSTHVLHNNTATFYGRDVVMDNLGFDTFTPVERMTDIERNIRGWAKDKVFTSEILKVLNSTEKQDLVYAISVQPHGKYPSEIVNENPEIEVTCKCEVEQEDINAMSYYVNEIYDVDKFIGDFLKKLESFDEDTVVVLYGDHLPALNFTNEELTTENSYYSEYVIWSNFDMEKKDKDLHTYQLSAEVMKRLGMNNGILTKLHQKGLSHERYYNYLYILEYDMLYGDNYSTNGINPYKETELKMGVTPLKILRVDNAENNIIIHGNGFTSFCKVYINGEQVETTLVEDTLTISEGLLQAGDSVIVKCLTSLGETLSETDPYIIS